MLVRQFWLPEMLCVWCQWCLWCCTLKWFVSGIYESMTNMSHEEGFVNILFSEINQEYPCLCKRNCKLEAVSRQTIKYLCNLPVLPSRARRLVSFGSEFSTARRTSLLLPCIYKYLYYIPRICIVTVWAYHVFMWNDGKKYSCWKCVSVFSYHGNARLRL